MVKKVKERKIKIVIGSLSPHKLEAVREACKQLEIDAVVTGMKAESGQNAQPFGMSETYYGALNRAMAARKKNPGAIVVGIESGLLQTGRDRFYADDALVWDIAVIVIILPDGERISGISPGIEFSNDYVDITASRSFETTTVGDIIAESLGGDKTDPHATLTAGKVTRKDLLVTGLLPLFKQIF